jgi:hypothetical protein
MILNQALNPEVLRVYAQQTLSAHVHPRPDAGRPPSHSYTASHTDAPRTHIHLSQRRPLRIILGKRVRPFVCRKVAIIHFLDPFGYPHLIEMPLLVDVSFQLFDAEKLSFL